ncbi:MAG: DUF5671 domain-containing protein [Actinomycetota bacterium]|nr:DUF5671 domain-containing protein [Actinomycetota bacterium]
MLGLLFPLAVIGGIVYAIVNATRSRDESGRAAPGGAISLRRLFQYVLLLAALVVAASGVSGVLGRVISDAAARRGTELAGPLALTVVGVPVFWLLSRWIWGQLQTDPAEQASVGWSFYLNAALIGSLSTAVSTAFAIAGRLIEGDGYEGTLVAPFVVAVAVWSAHWVVWRRTPPTVLADAQVMIGAAIGLGSMAGGAGFIIASAIDRAFEQARGVDVSRFFSDGFSMAIVAIGIGAVVWTWHWLRNGLHAERTNVWHGYVILVGILGGLLAAVIGGAIALFLTLQWLFGDPGTTSAAAHFEDASPAFAAAIIGLAIWFYHKTVLRFDKARIRTDIDRIYDYLVSGVALATVAGALTTLIVALFTVFGSSDVVSEGDSDVNIVISAVTLLLVGTPLWAVAWRHAQRALATDTQHEATSPARRVYLFAVFGIGGAVAFGALIRLVFVVFEAILGERSGGAVLDDIRVPIGLLVTTGAIAAYHWSVYRAERTVEQPRLWRDVTLVWAGNGDAREIEQRAHVRLSVMHRLDIAGPVPTADTIVAAIDETEGECLLVMADTKGVTVIPVVPSS